jgi:hypothetical protein
MLRLFSVFPTVLVCTAMQIITTTNSSLCLFMETSRNTVNFPNCEYYTSLLLSIISITKALDPGIRLAVCQSGSAGCGSVHMPAVVNIEYPHWTAALRNEQTATSNRTLVPLISIEML